MNRRILQKINELLLKEWDPIGVAETPGAEDEYSQYAEFIHKIIQGSSSHRELFAYLWELETEHMGLKGNRIKTEDFAKMLFHRFA
jgi:hypothetical protein